MSTTLLDERYGLREAAEEDAATLALHRGMMFRDMGLASDEAAREISAAATPWFRGMFQAGLYRGWLIACDNEIVAGGGLHLTEIGPLPGMQRVGRSAHIANVYTAEQHRRRGLARVLLETALSWCNQEPIDQVTLTASPEGRALYTALGFEPQPDGMLKKLRGSV